MGETLQKVESHVESHRSAHAFFGFGKSKNKKKQEAAQKESEKVKKDETAKKDTIGVEKTETAIIASSSNTSEKKPIVPTVNTEKSKEVNEPISSPNRSENEIEDPSLSKKTEDNTEPVESKPTEKVEEKEEKPELPNSNSEFKSKIEPQPVATPTPVTRTDYIRTKPPNNTDQIVAMPPVRTDVINPNPNTNPNPNPPVQVETLPPKTDVNTVDEKATPIQKCLLSWYGIYETMQKLAKSYYTDFSLIMSVFSKVNQLPKDCSKFEDNLKIEDTACKEVVNKFRETINTLPSDFAKFGADFANNRLIECKWLADVTKQRCSKKFN